MKNIFLTAIAAVTIGTSAHAQIPNAGFENWTSKGSYSNPNSWGCLNDLTSPMSVYTCTKATPGVEGSSYIKLVSKNVTGVGVVPGIAVSGTIDMQTMKGTGFAYSQRPASFNGSWQYMPFGSSVGFVRVEFTRWDANSGLPVSVGSAYQDLNGMAMSWTTFSMPITYLDPGNPDTCIITLSASGSTPTVNDYLYVDNLSFVGGSSTGIKEATASVSVRVFPNPVSDKLEIETVELNGKDVNVEVFDLLGKKVISVARYGSSDKMIDVSFLPKGEYLVKLNTTDEVITTRFLKN